MVPKKRPLFPAAVFLMVLMLVSAGCTLIARKPAAEPLVTPAGGPPPRILAEPRPAPPFVLTAQDGQPFHYTAGNSDATMLFFGYTFCPDVCPVTMGDYRQVIRGLGDDAGRVRFLFVSVDPERDTPERLKEYLGNFDPSIIGLTGEAAEVRKVIDQYGIYAEKRVVAGTQASYLMAHTASIFLVDAAGKIRVDFPFGARPEAMVAEIRKILGEALATRKPPLSVSDPWARAAKASAMAGMSQGGHGSAMQGSTSAVYMVLTNDGPRADALLAARTEVAAVVEIHETKIVDSVMQMRPVPKVEVPAGGKAELKRGGYHVMLMGLRQDLVAETKIKVVLVFEKAGEMTIEAEVRDP